MARSNDGTGVGGTGSKPEGTGGPPERLAVPASFVKAFRRSALGTLSADADQLESVCVAQGDSTDEAIEGEAKALLAKLLAESAVLDQMGWMPSSDEVDTDVYADPAFLLYLLEEMVSTEYEPGEDRLREWAAAAIESLQQTREAA